MNFKAATEIARKSPGSVITRDPASGDFIVRLASGEIVAGEAGRGRSHDVTAEHQVLCEILEKERAASAEKEEIFQAELARMHDICRSLESSLQRRVAAQENVETDFERYRSESSERLAKLKRDFALLEGENKALKEKIARVSQEEWDRIGKEEAALMEKDVARRKSERSRIKCACRGEVENCARCFGAGHYFTDGFGNIV
jgi:hypothetical protein